MKQTLASIVQSTFYLNLDRRQDRRKKMEYLFKSLEISAQRIAAIDGKNLPQISYPNSRNAAEVACLMGHKRMWTHVSCASRPCFVCEDDLIVCKRFSEHWYQNHLDIPEEIDMLLLGASWPEGLHKINNNIVSLKSFWGSFAQILWPLGARKLLSHYNSDPNRVADWYARDLNHKGDFNVFMISPTWIIVEQDSDIKFRDQKDFRFGNFWEDSKK